MTSLATKYRPRNWGELVLPPAQKELLKSYASGVECPKALLFSGGHGSGKTSLARIFGKTTLCESPQEAPCGKCSSCLNFGPSSLDFREVDVALSGSVDMVRELVEESKYSSFGHSSRKVLVLDECHLLSKLCQTALLKVLEEAGEQTVFVFCTTEPQRLLPTLLSRCVTFRVDTHSESEVVSRLKTICELEQIPFSEEGLQLLAQTNSCHIRSSLMALEQLRFASGALLEEVQSYYGSELQAQICSLLVSMLGDEDFFSEVESLLKTSRPEDIFQGLMEAALASYKVSRGVKMATALSLECYQAVAKLYGKRLKRVLDFLSSRNPKTGASLECDILCLKSCVESGFPGELQSEITKPAVKQYASELDRIKAIGYKRLQTRPKEDDTVRVKLTSVVDVQKILGGSIE